MESHEERAYLEIKKAIFRRQLLPGTPIREVELAQYLSTSRTPIRQALRRLAREGLVVIHPNRGTFVAQPTPVDVRETFLLRGHLEGLAARLAAERITPSEVEELKGLLRDEHAAYSSSEPWNGLALSNTWHERIAAVCGHRRLQQYIGELVAQSYVHFALYDVIDPGCIRCKSEHEAILEALARRDGPAAERLMVEHFHQQMASLNLEHRSPVAPWIPVRQA